MQYSRQPQQPFRRPGGPMQHGPPQPQQPAQQQMSQQQMDQYRHEQNRRLELARRQSKKPTDREVPDELADVIVGDGVERYKKLRDVERRLDAVMMRKRLDISDLTQRTHTRREGVLRIWVSNTAEGQPWQVAEEGAINFGEDGTFDFGESSQATYRVKIEGKLLDDPTTEDRTEEEKKDDNARRPRLSHFFKSVTIEYDRNPNLQPDGFNAIEWKKPPTGSQNYDPNSSEVSFDTLEFERKSDENMNVTINLVREVKTERYKLSTGLAEILDTEEEDRAGVVQGIWEYCRVMGLQEDEDRRSVVCDDALRKLFNRDQIYFPHVPDLIMSHLSPLPPIQLAYTIRVDKPYISGDPSTSPPTPASAPTVYDIRVPLPNTITAQLHQFHASRSHISDLQTIIRTDDELALLVQKIHQTNAKRKFYENLAKDPASFVKRWFSSQMRDQEVIFAEGLRGGGEDAPGEVYRKGGEAGLWGSEGARESVGLWLARAGKAH